MNKGTLCVLLIFFYSSIIAQDSTITKISKWLIDNNISIRKTFDGSVNENKPGSLSFQENHKSENDYFNIDLAIKISELDVLKKTKSSSLVFYPKVEWHKSTDSTELKNKLDGGINFEFLPFKLKSHGLDKSLPNKGLIIAPWLQGTSSFKWNFIDTAFESKLTAQLSFASNYKFLPGSNFRDKKQNFRGRYYPYFGYEYNVIPNLITNGVTEKFFTCFFRLFIELWIFPRCLQLNIDGIYRYNLDNQINLKRNLPMLSTSLNFYPGKQESISLGYEYKQGYDSDSKFQLVQISSIKINLKL